jgi:hypothetical protein
MIVYLQNIHSRSYQADVNGAPGASYIYLPRATCCGLVVGVTFLPLLAHLRSSSRILMAYVTRRFIYLVAVPSLEVPSKSIR